MDRINYNFKVVFNNGPYRLPLQTFSSCLFMYWILNVVWLLFFHLMFIIDLLLCVHRTQFDQLLVCISQVLFYLCDSRPFISVNSFIFSQWGWFMFALWNPWDQQEGRQLSVLEECLLCFISKVDTLIGFVLWGSKHKSLLRCHIEEFCICYLVSLI